METMFENNCDSDNIVQFIVVLLNFELDRIFVALLENLKSFESIYTKLHVATSQAEPHVNVKWIEPAAAAETGEGANCVKGARARIILLSISARVIHNSLFPSWRRRVCTLVAQTKPRHGGAVRGPKCKVETKMSHTARIIECRARHFNERVCDRTHIRAHILHLIS